MVADLQDTILRAFLGPECPKVTRPADLLVRKEAHIKVQKTKEIIENTKWEAV